MFTIDHPTYQSPLYLHTLAAWRVTDAGSSATIEQVRAAYDTAVTANCDVATIGMYSDRLACLESH